jgi:hypothetical protein
MKLTQAVTRALGAAALILVSGLAVTSPAAATFTCNQDTGICTDDSIVQTPLGQVDISVSASNVVTVHLTPLQPRTSVVGIPQGHPPSPIKSGFVRTSVETIGGTVDIDTTQQGNANLAIISIHPPSPCRAITQGDTVVFTPRALG